MRSTGRTLGGGGQCIHDRRGCWRHGGGQQWKEGNRRQPTVGYWTGQRTDVILLKVRPVNFHSDERCTLGYFLSDINGIVNMNSINRKAMPDSTNSAAGGTHWVICKRMDQKNVHNAEIFFVRYFLLHNFFMFSRPISISI